MQRLARMPAETWAELRDFQQQGVEFGVQHGGRLLLADEMGVGKTCQVRTPSTTLESPFTSCVQGLMRQVGWCREKAT